MQQQVTGDANIKYTAVLPVEYVNALKKMANDKQIPSVNQGIRLAVGDFVKEHRRKLYEQQMREAAEDKGFLNRTLETQEAFTHADSEETGQW